MLLGTDRSRAAKIGTAEILLGVARAIPAPIASRLDPITAELHVTPTPPFVLATVKEQRERYVKVVGEIAAVAADFLKRQRRPIDLIVPAPPSATRHVQPVVLLAESIGAALKIPVAGCVTTTRPSSQLKDITDPAERAEALAGLYAVNVRQTKGKAILLFDDLYRSGSTLNAISSLLLDHGSAAQVNVLTITRTRSNR